LSPAGDDDAGHPQVAQGCGDDRLGRCVEVAGGFVKEQDFRPPV
jgi:hypothetical protein